MKKIHLTAILIICILILNIGFIGCSNIKDKSNASKNHPSATSKINGMGITNSSPDTAAVMPTQQVNSPSGHNVDVIDYSQYIRKVWIVKNSVNDNTDYYPSFHISKIENGKILGELSLIDPSLPNPDYHTTNDIGYWGDFTGIISKGIAKCQFRFKTGDTGNVKLIFKSNKEIIAAFEYKIKSQEIKDEVQNCKDIPVDLHLDGTFQFRPYNLNDFQGFSPFKDQSFIVNLNSWGNIRFVSGKFNSGKHMLTLCCLTNKDGDILYDFGSPFPYDVDIKAVSFKDVNKDRLKDIIIIADCGDPKAYVYFQKIDGSFYIDDKLNNEINSSGNNKDIKTVTNYLLG